MLIINHHRNVFPGSPDHDYLMLTSFPIEKDPKEDYGIANVQVSFLSGLKFKNCAVPKYGILHFVTSKNLLGAVFVPKHAVELRSFQLAGIPFPGRLDVRYDLYCETNQITYYGSSVFRE